MASPSSLRAWYARERLKCAGPHMHRLTCLLCAASLKRTAVCCVGRDSVWDQSLALREFINISSLRFSLYCRGLIDDDGIPTLVRADKDEVELRLKAAVHAEALFFAHCIEDHPPGAVRRILSTFPHLVPEHFGPALAEKLRAFCPDSHSAALSDDGGLCAEAWKTAFLGGGGAPSAPRTPPAAAPSSPSRGGGAASSGDEEGPRSSSGGDGAGLEEEAGPSSSDSDAAGASAPPPPDESAPLLAGSGPFELRREGTRPFPFPVPFPSTPRMIGLFYSRPSLRPSLALSPPSPPRPPLQTGLPAAMATAAARGGSIAAADACWRRGRRRASACASPPTRVCPCPPLPRLLPFTLSRGA